MIGRRAVAVGIVKTDRHKYNFLLLGFYLVRFLYHGCDIDISEEQRRREYQPQ